MSFLPEEIPNEDLVFKWIPRSKFDDDGRVDPVVFADKNAGMSANWSRYSTAATSREMSKNPERVGVVSLSVAGMRALELAVRHTPKSWNRSHADVLGPKTVEVQMKLARLAFPPALKPPPKKDSKKAGK